IDPEIDARDHALRQVQLVILEESDAALEGRILRGLEDALEHSLAGIVRGMRLPGKDDLHGTAWIGEQTAQAVRIAEEQIRPLVGGEATRETEGQDVGREQGAG